MELKLRQATLDDYDAILAIDPDNPNDHIPSLFYQYMRDPHRIIIVATLKGKMVAMVMFNTVDNGKTIVGMSARSHPDLRGEGVMRFVMNSPELLINHPSPGLVHYAHITAFPWNKIKGKREGPWAEPNIILKRQYLDYEFTPEEIEKIEVKRRPNGILTRILTNEECFKHLRNTDTQWKIFPNRRIVCDPGGVPYRLLDENFHRIVSNRKEISASLGLYDDCLSIVFGTGYDVRNGYLYSIHYHGYDPHDVNDIISHVLVHLCIAVKHQSKQPLRIRIVVPIETPMHGVTAGCKKVPGFSHVVGSLVQVQVYEQKLGEPMIAKL